jgi:RNA polymerase sigma-70 factor (ECF subfamily)
MYFDDIRNYIFYRSGDTELATDIAQETFMKVWEKKLQVSKKQGKGLLIKISGDLFVSRYRKQKTEMNFKLKLKPEDTSRSPEEKMEFEELSEKYDRALKTLPEKQRVVFLMSRMDDLTYKEIASALGLSIKAVEKRMNQALEFLRNALKE